MLKVLFFARLREELDCEQLAMEWREDVARLDALQEHLCQRGGSHWRAVLAQHNIIRAVNHSVIDGDCTLADGDEVAFFPPVTGG